MKGDARDEEILEVLTGLYNAGGVECAEGQLRVSPVLNSDDIRVRGSKYSIRFDERLLVELIDQSRVPVSDELVRVLLCLIYHEHARYPWVTKESVERVV